MKIRDFFLNSTMTALLYKFSSESFESTQSTRRNHADSEGKFFRQVSNPKPKTFFFFFNKNECEFFRTFLKDQQNMSNAYLILCLPLPPLKKFLKLVKFWPLKVRKLLKNVLLYKTNRVIWLMHQWLEHQPRCTVDVSVTSTVCIQKISGSSSSSSSSSQR